MKRKHPIVLAKAILLFVTATSFMLVSCSSCSDGKDKKKTWYQDADSDGYGNIIQTLQKKTQPNGYVIDNTDCDDSNPLVYPGAVETADDVIDQDCDSFDLKTWYKDADNDGYGDPTETVTANDQPNGYVGDNTDCDYSNPLVYPGAVETADDGIDQDCDSFDLKTWYKDADNDGYGDPTETVTANDQPEGYLSDNTDCDDTDPAINPDKTEIYGDGIDQNCDGSDLLVFYRDIDGDGYGDKNSPTKGISQPDGYVSDNTDCNDTDPSIHPGATEVCGDGVDQNCDMADLNCVPVATIENPVNNTVVTVGKVIQFQGSGTDTGGSISSYEWNFGDGSTSSEKNPTYTYYENGTFVVTLKVTDDVSAVSTIDESITLIIDWPSPQTNELRMTFNYIPEGTFAMGSPDDEYGRDDNETQHTVTLSKPFYLQTTEVTQEQWKMIDLNNPSFFKDCDECPVESVSWEEVEAYIATLNELGTGTYRLPTEAEWEYAARARTGTEFASGEILGTSTDSTCPEDSNLDSIGWYCRNTYNTTHEVAQKSPNGWGIYDMHGNVWEWLSDYYDGEDYEDSTVIDPTGPASGTKRAFRGGGWTNNPRICRVANRDGFQPELKSNVLGFRLVKEE